MACHTEKAGLPGGLNVGATVDSIQETGAGESTQFKVHKVESRCQFTVYSWQGTIPSLKA